MSSSRLHNPVKHFVSIAALSALGSMLLAASPAAAANPDACGLATQQTMAHAFGLTNSVQHKSVLREPGNPAGVIHIRCRASAWKGQQPTTPASQRTGLLAGTFATYRIETWAADPESTAGTWLANFPGKLEGLRSRAKAQFTEGALQGSAFKPPLFGAESVLGYQATKGGLRKMRAFWWNSSTGTLISFNVVESREKPAGASLRNLAAQIVPRVE